MMPAMITVMAMITVTIPEMIELTTHSLTVPSGGWTQGVSSRDLRTNLAVAGPAQE